MSKDLVLDVLSDIRLSSAQEDTVPATSFNEVLTEVIEGPQTIIVVSSANIVEFTPKGSSQQQVIDVNNYEKRS